MKVEKNDIINKLGKIDLLICSSGFEDRSTNLANCLNPELILDSILFHLDDTYAISQTNLEKIQKEITNTRIVSYPKNKPLDTFDIFYLELQKISIKSAKKSINVVIDVSTFTREVLLILVKVVSLQQFSNFDVKIVYTPNEAYSSEDQTAWMTKGIREIRSIIGYSGLHSPSKKLMLLILNGFEEERTEQIIESFEPSKLVIGKPNASDSINYNLNVISCEKFNHIKSKYQYLVPQEFEFSCTDIDITINELNRIIEDNSDYNIVISPLNNKISTVAAAIVGIKNDDVQICYASANQYNIDAKSKASDYFLVYNLDRLLHPIKGVNLTD